MTLIIGSNIGRKKKANSEEQLRDMAEEILQDLDALKQKVENLKRLL